jgi:hypothetical protein
MTRILILNNPLQLKNLLLLSSPLKLNSFISNKGNYSFSNLKHSNTPRLPSSREILVSKILDRI